MNANTALVMYSVSKVKHQRTERRWAGRSSVCTDPSSGW